MPAPLDPTLDGMQHDIDWTLDNSRRLSDNPNLLYWYQELYREQFAGIADPDNLKILEIGSGTSPLRLFRSKVITSDVLDLPYLDLVFDCHRIDELAEIGDQTLDVITLTNVLHHLREPLLFLEKAVRKLKQGGVVIFTEPYFSLLSTPIYRLLHHEPADFKIERPMLDHVVGPLSSANMAMPQLIFLGNKGWGRELERLYSFSGASVSHFTFLSYMATGGISRRLPVPHFLYRLLFPVDRWLARRFPKIFSSFFTVRLTRK